jgi:hypothetical protein
MAHGSAPARLAFTVSKDVLWLPIKFAEQKEATTCGLYAGIRIEPSTNASSWFFT